jgi:hypothetical protein
VPNFDESKEPSVDEIKKAIEQFSRVFVKRYRSTPTFYNVPLGQAVRDASFRSIKVSFLIFRCPFNVI